MLEYYARFLREVKRSVFLFWKGQIAVGLAAGLITAVANAMNGVTPESIALASVIAVAIGYMVILGIAFMGSVICAPVNLDRLRVAEIGQKESFIRSSLSEIATLNESAKATAAASRSEITVLNEALNRKHPHDEYKEAQIKKAFSSLNQSQVDAFARLLDAGEMPRGRLQGMGLDADHFHSRDNFPPLLGFRPFRPGNGTVEIDRFYYINQGWTEALKNVLYPSDRPVTPPPT